MLTPPHLVWNTTGTPSTNVEWCPMAQVHGPSKGFPTEYWTSPSLLQREGRAPWTTLHAQSKLAPHNCSPLSLSVAGSNLGARVCSLQMMAGRDMRTRKTGEVAAVVSLSTQSQRQREPPWGGGLSPWTEGIH